MKQTFKNFWNSVTAVHPSIQDVEERGYSKLLAMLFSYLIPVFTLVVLRSLLFPTGGTPTILAPMLFVLMLVAYVINHQGYSKVSANLWIFGTAAIVTNEAFMHNTSYMLLVLFLIFMQAVLLLSIRSVSILGILSLIALALYAVTQPPALPISPTFSIFFFVLGGTILIAFTNYRAKIEAEQRQELLNANEALRQSEASLEQRVKERTRDLELAIGVSRQITTILDQDQLLKAIADQTKEAFHLYHVSVFTYQEKQQQMMLAAGSGETGEKMRELGYDFPLHLEKGLVPHAGRTRTSILANDVSTNPTHTPNPLLPQTRAELAVPMIANNTLIGVLDLQSDSVNYFSDDIVRVISMLAEQLAIAVENATLFDEVETARREQVAVAEKLRAVDNMKSQFLASMSHELRTPLNAILNFTKFVQTGMLGPVNDKQKDALNKTIGSGKHLLALINDVLDITKIESDMLNLFVEEDVSLSEELESIVATAETLLSEKPEVKFVGDYEAELIPDIVCDKRRVRQILLNLVSNACKFTEEGQITLSIRIENEMVNIVVKDTGPGIPAEDHELIFEPFRQSHAGMTNGGGTGLGLPIARRLAEAHGGSLAMESVVGQGTTFFVTLPVASAKLLDMTKMGKAS